VGRVGRERGAGDPEATTGAPTRTGGERGALARAVVYFLLTRGVLFMVAAVAIRLLPVGLQAGTERYLPRSQSIGTWLRWDAWWYVSVAERGYWFDPAGQSNVAFFPLFPLLIRMLTALTGNPVVAGFLLANAAALGAVVALWVWVRAEAGPDAAERAARWLAVFPFSFVFHTIYAESLFFLLVTLSLLASARARWPLAGLLGGLAAATRPMGVLLLPAYAWAMWQAWRGGRRPDWADLLGLGLIPAGLAAYAGYLWIRFGDPLVFARAHATGWGVSPGWDLAGYERGAVQLLRRGVRVQSYAQLVDLLGVLLPLVFLVLAVAVFRRLGVSAGIYTALVVLVAVLFAPESVGRELLAAVPAFAVMGLLDRGGSLGEGVRLVAFGCGLLLLFAFATGHFVG
jgi:hypothetical protein